VTCSACGHANAPTQRFCGQCGAPLDEAAGVTHTSPIPIARATPAPSSDGGRFLPGTMLAGRYRVIGLLGRGGMGEVYRADDLKLGQPVALKFLPRDVERDPDRLERFLTEVRLSLRVTHPNVCRVFDIGQIDDRQFLSMEYVDGEDLASLLRRIGRLPEDKAIEIARQLCAGLAAAHDEGVLHRDLKPANVMIDGRGRAKITDFGLAGATQGISGLEARAGTPHYMAPEQIEGRTLDQRTDIYSLGLVLYELFTGKRAFESRDITDLARVRSSTPTTPSAHVSGLDPAIERAILRCVDPDPAKRPASASTLAASLPGGDPLAMAIAAGETPSPEMVAGAGGEGRLSPPVAAACLMALLAGLIGVWFMVQKTTMPNLVPLPKPPTELAPIARTLVNSVGYTSAPVGVAFGFEIDGQYFDKVEQEDPSIDRWDNLASVAPAPVWFWYRESPRPLRPSKDVGSISSGDPPLLLPGMLRVRLDPAGRLQQFRAVPPDLAPSPGPWLPPDWAPLFAAAGLQPIDWTPAEPIWAPPDATDVRAAWTRGALRVEGGAFRGRPVWFAIVPDWRRARGDARAQPAAALVFAQLVSAALIAAGVWLAWRNIRMGRSDLRGATRLAAVYVALGFGYDLLLMPGAALAWYDMASRSLALQLYSGMIVWVFYTALEPYVRRLWPDTLISWTRLLDGRFRDPLVGRHVLVGGLAGILFSFNFMAPQLAADWLGIAPLRPPSGGLEALAGSRASIAGYFLAVQDSFFVPIVVLLVVLVLRVLLRRPWVAYVVLVAISAAFAMTATPAAPVARAVTTTITVIIALFLLTRFGLLAFLVGIVFSYWQAIPLTMDPSSWFFPASVLTMLLFAGIAVYGFVVSIGGQALFRDPVFSSD
jgi:serine/threonine-protein kinase